MKEELYPLLPTRDNFTFFAELIGISYCDGTYFAQRENSTIYVLEYIVAGTGTVIMNGDKYTASAGDIYLLSPGYHRYYSDKENPWTKIFINMYGPLIPNLLHTYGLEGKVIFPRCPLEPLFYDLISLAQGKLRQEPMMDLCALKVHEIFLSMAAHLENRKETFSEEAIRVKRILDGNLSRRVSIEELAKAIFRSPDYTIKLFRKEFGQTPYAYAIERKILMAQHLLRESRMPVQEIAKSVGYPDPHYFSHVFYRQCGCSPTQYRKQNSTSPSRL